MERHGFRLIRFRNEMVLNDRDAVIAAIRKRSEPQRRTLSCKERAG